jgi:hypothetical protein
MKMKFLGGSSTDGGSEGWGVRLYWTASVIAALIVAGVIWDYMYGILNGDPIIRIIPMLFAGAIWLGGCACRHVLATR